MSASENTLIELGDVIQIIAPSNSQINDKIYMVDYIDEDIIKLLDVTNLTGYSLNIRDGNLTDESITSINILDRPEVSGYASQKGYIPGTWLDVYFSGDRPMVVTGKVSDLDNDMIEIKTFPDNKTIYIDFAYKGLPKELPIERINIRNKPEQLIQQEQDKRLAAITEEDVSMEDDLERQEVEQEVRLENIDDKLRALFKDVQNIVIGEDLGQVKEVIEVSEEKQRFGIEAQTNNLLDDLLSTIPAADRTRVKLNNIHTMIERFKQLRLMFSEFDVYGNITQPIVHGAQYKPLVKELENLSTKLYWLIPVAVNKRKVFDIESEIVDEVNDVLPMTLAELRIQEDDIVKTYMDSSIPEGENKVAFLIQNLNPYLTPFVEPTYPDNQITNINVKQDIAVVVDNQDDFYSSAASNNDIVRTRFVMQNYNKGIMQLEISDRTGPSLATTSRVIVPGDKLSLKSMLMLPEPAIRFSHINLPATDIMTKADYSRHFINYWEYLNDSTFINTTNIESFVTQNVEDMQRDDEYIGDAMFKQIKEYVYTPSSTGEDESERYSKFLNTIIPKTRILFNKFKKYIKDGLSVHTIVEVLEPFMVYYSDLTFKQYSEMTEFIQNEIIEFKKRFVAKSREFNTLKLTRYRISSIKPSLIRIFNDAPDLFQQIAEYYGIITSGQDIRSMKQFAYNDSELTYIMLRKDSMRAYMAAVSLMNINLHLDVNVDTLLEQNADSTANNMTANMSSNNCAKFVLSKKYTSLQELEIDNNNPLVYYDKEYDPTRYEIISEYENEMTGMPQDEFEMFIINKLKESIGLNEQDARIEAQSMIDGNRLVAEGDYALLEMKDDTGSVSRFYYKRQNNAWQQDTEIDTSVFADTNKMLCDTQLPCFQIKKSCLDKDIANDTVLKNDIESMLKSFEYQYSLSRQELNMYIREKVDRSLRMLPKLSKLNQHKILRYNKQQVSIGADVAERNITTSPYESVRDTILGQSDFVKKQNDIIRFKYSFTRAATEDENPYWLYCIETQTKLLPTFVFTLAEAFASQQTANNIDEYRRALDKVCADRGTISEDGNMWVDKHSGYEIKTIEFDTDEGYEDTGYKMVSREVMQKDAGDYVLVGQEPDDIISQDTKYVHNIVRALSSFLGIDVSAKLDFISTNTAITLAEIVGPEKAYNEKSAKMEKLKGKRLPPYQDMKNTVLIMLTLSYFVVAIQTTIPSIRTRKTFPGCIKSFTGYPLQDGTDMSSIIYIACVANKIKSSVDPWSGLAKHNEKTITKKMIDLTNKHIMSNATIREMMREKQAYLLIEEEEYIPMRHEIGKWSNFLPPLMQIKLPTVRPLRSGFEESLSSSVRSGSVTQMEELNAVRGKIVQYAMEIQKSIGKVVSEQDPILTNAAMEPFLSNSCCNDEGNISTIEYFTKRQPDIKSDNLYVSRLSDILSDIRFMRMAPFFYDNQDTRLVYPELNNSFSEETIYKAFIAYCKYNSDLPVSNDLKRICSDKPSIFDQNSNIKEKIKSLKDQGKMFDSATLTELMNIINSRNLVTLNIENASKDPIQILRDRLIEIDAKDTQMVPKEFIDKFNACLDTYDTSSSDDSETVRDFKNYLATQIDLLTKEIVREIRDKSTLPKASIKTAVTFIETLMTWATIRKPDNSMSDEDSTLFNIADFITNILSDSISVFPNIILNKVSYSDLKIPRHWSLSERHQSDVKNVISSYYGPLKQFYGDTDLDPILNKIQTDSKDILDLMKETRLVSDIEELSVSPLLNTEFVGLLYNYYFITTFYQYILLANSPQFLVKEQPIVATDLESESATIDPLLDQLEDFDSDMVTQIDIVQGEDAMIKRKNATLINSMLSIFANTKRQLNLNYDTIMERILRSKEKEKESVTQRLKDMTDEAREIDTEFKRHKLGEWGKGLEKGLTQYVQDTYDQEREALDKRLALEKQLNVENIVSEMNMDIYVMDIENQLMREAEMDKEAYSMHDVQGENEEEQENDGF